MGLMSASNFCHFTKDKTMCLIIWVHHVYCLNEESICQMLFQIQWITWKIFFFSDWTHSVLKKYVKVSFMVAIALMKHLCIHIYYCQSFYVHQTVQKKKNNAFLNSENVTRNCIFAKRNDYYVEHIEIETLLSFCQ